MRCKTSFSTQFFDSSYYDDIGKKAAEWMRDQFLLHGYNKLDLVPVDWGWIVVTSTRPVLSWFGCSHEIAHSDRWSIIIGTEPKFVQKVFRKTLLQEHFEKLQSTIDEILQTIPDIQDIEWQRTETDLRQVSA